MKKRSLLNCGGTLLVALSLAACGSSGSGSGNLAGGENLTLGVTSLNTKTVVAAAPKSRIETMLALLGGKEVFAIAGNCADPAREFDLSDASGTASVCLETARIVYEEVELETEGGVIKDEVEAGPFLVDLIGVPDDGISGTITLNVPVGNFNKLELKVGDLDDRDNNDRLDDNGTDIIPTNVSAIDANAAGMAGKSMRITGTADDGAGNMQPFTFVTNIEGKMEMPITLAPGDPLVIDGSTLVTFIDLSTGFKRLAFADITATMDGSFSDATESCSTPANKFQSLSCDIVKNVELFHDINDDNKLDDAERRGDDRGGVAGARAFDDNPDARD